MDGDEYCDEECRICTNFFSSGVLDEGNFDGGDCDPDPNALCVNCVGGCISSSFECVTDLNGDVCTSTGGTLCKGKPTHIKIL